MWKEIQRYIVPEGEMVLHGSDASELIVQHLPTHPSLEQIRSFEQYLATLPQYQGETFHYFGDRVYTRVWTQAADTVVTGKMHRLNHVIMLLAGEVTMTTELGTMRVKAPWVEEGAAGRKRIVVAHVDSVIATNHPNPTNTRDLKQLEAELIMDPDSIIDVG